MGDHISRQSAAQGAVERGGFLVQGVYGIQNALTGVFDTAASLWTSWLFAPWGCWSPASTLPQERGLALSSTTCPAPEGALGEVAGVIEGKIAEDRLGIFVEDHEAATAGSGDVTVHHRYLTHELTIGEEEGAPSRSLA